MNEMNYINYEVNMAARGSYIVPGFNVFGYEDAQAVIHAAERHHSPVLLMVNRDARRALALEHWSALLGSLARNASVPVAVHLDHCSDLDDIFQAVDVGFHSVMYDGSKLPLEENIANTKRVAEYAHARGVAVEAEVGTVPYSDMGEVTPEFTRPEEAARMAAESGADWLAVSGGNIHRQTCRATRINFQRLEEIQKVCSLPLVLHGSSGVLAEDLAKVRSYRVGKVNIGTALRQVFGGTLRATVLANPNTFDRLTLLEQSCEQAEDKAYELIGQMVV